MLSPQLLVVRNDEARNQLDHSPRSLRFPRLNQPILADLQSLATSQAHQVQSSVTFKNPQPFSSEPIVVQATPHYVADQQYRESQSSGPRDSVLSIHALGEDRRRSSVISTFDRSWRHSDMTSPGGLVSRLGDFNMSTPHHNSFALGSSPTVEASCSQLLTGLAESELEGLETSARKRFSWNRPKTTASVDALINPVRLRRSLDAPLDMNVPGDNKAGPVSDDSNWVTIRARVTPRARDKKPFVIQRRFDVKAVRASALQRRSSRHNNDELPDRTKSPGSPSATPTEMHRASPVRRDSLRSNSTSKRRESTIEKRHDRMPIHVEYALQYMPILAAILLSGHVKKGDVIDLPVPRPDVWSLTMLFIYNPKGPLYAGVRENIEYFAGIV